MKALLVRSRPVEVAVGQADPRDADFPHFPGRPGPVRVWVEDDHGVGRQRHPDRDGPAGVQQRPRRGHGRLGGTVDVQKPPAGPVPAGDQILRARFPGHQQEPQLRMLIGERGQQRRHTAEGGYLPRDQERCPDPGPAGPGRPGHERGPAHPRHPDLLDGEVERDRHALTAPGRPRRSGPVHLGRHPDTAPLASGAGQHVPHPGTST